MRWSSMGIPDEAISTVAVLCRKEVVTRSPEEKVMRWKVTKVGK
jgi:hypothetical protein